MAYKDGLDATWVLQTSASYSTTVMMVETLKSNDFVICFFTNLMKEYFTSYSAIVQFYLPLKFGNTGQRSFLSVAVAKGSNKMSFINKIYLPLAYTVVEVNGSHKTN